MLSRLSIEITRESKAAQRFGGVGCPCLAIFESNLDLGADLKTAGKPALSLHRSLGRLNGALGPCLLPDLLQPRVLNSKSVSWH